MENELQPHQPDADPAAAVFAQLVEEVGVVRRLVAANDNTATLGEIVQRLDKLVEVIRVLSRRPAMTLTPDEMAIQIAAAAEKARAGDQVTIAQAKERLEKAVRLIEWQTGKIATIRQQRRRLAWAGGGSLLAGILLWSFLPGTIARAAPESWHWPERMALHILGESSIRLAGARLIKVSDPDQWSAIVTSMKIPNDNGGNLSPSKHTQAAAKHGAPLDSGRNSGIVREFRDKPLAFQKSSKAEGALRSR